MTRVAIYEEHFLLGEGIRRLLACDPSIRVVDRIAGAAWPESDVAVVDGRLRDAMAAIRPGGARPWVIFLAPEPGDDWAGRALIAGARGVMEPTSTPEDLVQAVRAVDQGHIWAREQLVCRVLGELVALSDAVRSTEVFLTERLGARERDVTDLVSRGLSNREIAHELGIAEATVKAYLSSVFRKLGVRDRGQLSALFHRTRRIMQVPITGPAVLRAATKPPSLVAAQGLTRKGSDRTA